MHDDQHNTRQVETLRASWEPWGAGRVIPKEWNKDRKWQQTRPKENREHQQTKLGEHGNSIAWHDSDQEVRTQSPTPVLLELCYPDNTDPKLWSWFIQAFVSPSFFQLLPCFQAQPVLGVSIRVHSCHCKFGPLSKSHVPPASPFILLQPRGVIRWTITVIFSLPLRMSASNKWMSFSAELEQHLNIGPGVEAACVCARWQLTAQKTQRQAYDRSRR